MSQRTSAPTPNLPHASKTTWLVIALVLTLSARAIPDWLFLARIWKYQLGGEETLSYALFHDLVLLALGTGLAVCSPRRSGLRIGTLRGHWRGLFVVCAAPILLTALV